MTVLILQSQVLGPFKSVETLSDRLRCDNTDYPFTVIGDYSLSEDDSLAPPPPVPPTPVPSEVSPRQIRQALTAMALRDPVEYAVSQSDQDTKDWWEFATTFERAHPMVAGMAQALGVSEQQLDQLFILAGSL